MMEYDINRPWMSLDPWQEDYAFKTPPNQDCFLLCGRQVGKTTAMSIKAIELCIKHFKKGEFVLINSITEKQAYHMLAKALAYAQEKYPKLIISKGKDKYTKHKLLFKNGTGVLCYAAGEEGGGLRGFTIKKLMTDEGSRMSDEYFIAASPMMSVIKGSMDIASTPCGKEGFFYKCSLDKRFKRFYVSAEDCPRHTKEFLDIQKERLPALAYAQEYLAQFLDDLKRVFKEELLNKCCILKRPPNIRKGDSYYLGVDIARMGEDEGTYEILRKVNNKLFHHVENIITKKKRTTETEQKIIELELMYKFRKIGIDAGAGTLGVSVLDHLLVNSSTRSKVVALNSRQLTQDREQKSRITILNEDMYNNLISMMEHGEILLLDDDEVRASLSSIQFEHVINRGQPTKLRIFGSYSHVAEGLIRAAWEADKDRRLDLFIEYTGKSKVLNIWDD